ncbi:pullulanase-type alpha-1,6-glucosidase [Actinomadura sp. ATCC 31491]|uniref:alpha-amylase n=1 Tax=Actinomadura luzonensis TaxID=2805427 RepID=A0ABT0G3J8_9ACTN|nr:pullulanase-type alpha-1,6-glucosidase [Actinomadura luzonensis]MCK2219145.1 pullulanase-type alpha-1,6-glucosidase [Actinomadura luzonensis]
MKDLLVVHYRRADHDGWGLHVWGDVARPTGWRTPLIPVGEDSYGRFAWIPLTPGARAVGVLPHRGDVKDGGDRVVDPSRTPEIWLTEGREDVFASRAAAEGHAVIRYRRADGAYDGWGLHVWGEAVADGAVTRWTRPRPPDGADSFGVYWRVPLRDPERELGFVVHAGAAKDPGPDQRIVPARQPEAYVNSGSPIAHPTRAAADGVIVLHYRRPDGDHDGWELHPGGGAAEPGRPLPPAGRDAFGAVFRVPLAAGAPSLTYDLRDGDGRGGDRRDGLGRDDDGRDGGGRGDGRDPVGEVTLETVLSGHEVWRVAGAAGHVLPRPPRPDADLRHCRAHWIDRDTVLWQVPRSLRHVLAFDPDAAITFDGHDLDGDPARAGRVRGEDGGEDGGGDGGGGGGGGGAGGGGAALGLPGELTGRQRRKWPHLAGYTVLKVDPRDARQARAALRGQVVAVARDADGGLVAATGVQLPGVLDDLYAAAATATLGPTGRLLPRLALWAPTARTVELVLHGDERDAGRAGEDGGGRRAVHRMRRDGRTGVWSAHGSPGWAGRDYTFLVTAYSPAAGAMVTSEVTDPYSLATAPDGVRSRLTRLEAAATKPPGWDDLVKPAPVPPHQAAIYELHVRDFSASDSTVPAELRGTYAAFGLDSAGMRELRELARDGVTHVHLLPVFDLATVPERRADRAEPTADLAALPPDSELQQEHVLRTAARDSFNWGYDPLHYTVPEGSYATDPDDRIRQFRAMVAALNQAGLRVVMDVVYNHAHSESVLDPIVPGYYHRLLEDGSVATSTCCANTAPEHLMMGRLVVDSVVTWARHYKIDGFRFDLMGHHPKDNILAVRRALDALTPEADGVDGRSIILYGEGWNFGEVADDARFEQATQANLAGTGVATFADGLRDAVRGGGPFDADPRVQGFGSGLAGSPNGSPANGGPEQQRARLAHYADLIRVGLTGNLRDYLLPSGRTAADLRHNGSPAGYTAAPGEAVLYVDAHDNETLFDALAYKLPPRTPMADRVRMHVLSLALALLSQGAAFVHAGSERLRSKSFDRNSYDSGDWFNRLLWDCSAGNGFGGGLPPRADNEARWAYARPLLADPALRPGCPAIEAARARFGELLRIRASTPAFALGSAEEVRRRLTFPASPEGVIAMHVDTAGLDERWRSVTVVFNATPAERRQPVPALVGREVALHPVQAGSADPVVRASAAERGSGTLVVPGRTVAVFVGG